MNTFLPFRRVVGCFVSLLALSTFSYAQMGGNGACPNSDFSMGNFTNWTGAIGNCCPINVPTPGIFAGRQTIMNAGTDPNTGNALQYIPPGWARSARLGNSNTGAEAEMLRYNMTVSPANALYIYNFAVVMEDPGHIPAEQPRFELQVRDASGQIIACTYYQVVASGNIPGFQNFGAVRWRNWTQVGVDLSSYVGQNITVEARTGDCDQGGHYGYAYITSTCQPMQIQVDYCLGDTIAQLTAPPGFQSYQWSTGQTTQAISITNPAQFPPNISVTVTSVMGCQATLNVLLTPTIVTSAFSGTANCNGQIQFTNQSNVNIGNITNYIWDFGDGNTSTQANPSHTYVNPGTYNVQLTSTSNIGCTHDTIIPVVVPPRLQAAITMPASGCGLTQTFTNNTQLIGGGSIQSLQWSVNGVPTGGNTNQLTYTFPSPGNYSITLLATNTAGCTSTVTQNMTIYALPAPQFTAPMVCMGSATQFTNQSTVQGGVISGWAWNFGNGNNSTQQNPSYQYPAPGSYNVQLTVTGPGNCTSTTSHTVNVSPNPVASFTMPANCGLGQTFTNTSTIPGGSITGYSWNFNPGNYTSSNATHTFANPGNYNVTLTVTSDSGCTNTATLPYVANAIPVAAFSGPTTCHPAAVPFNNTSSVQGNGALNYQWTFGDNTNGTTTSPSHAYANPGSYNVQLIVTGPGNCADTISHIVNTPPTPVANFSLPANCGMTQSFTNTSTISGGSINGYSWNFNPGTYNTSNASHTFGNPGNYNVVLTVTSDSGCANTVTIPYVANAIPVAAFSGPTTCHPNAVPFNNTSSIQGNGALNYQWSFGDNTNGTITSPSHAYANAGSYTVQLIATGPGGCADTILHTVNTPPTPVANFNLPGSCGMSQLFTNASTISNGTITNNSWSFNPGSYTTTNATHAFANPGNYNVTLTVTSDSGCTSTVTLPYVANAVPVAAFSGPTTCHPAAVPFNNTSNIQGGGALNYQWSFGDNSNSTNTSPSHAYANAGSYTVQLIATGPGNCVDTIVHVVNTPPTPTANFTLPAGCGMTQAFTNTSTISNGSITSHAWNFNPGTSNTINPSHTFSNPGNYNVVLTVTSDSGCTNTMTLPYVANAIPVAAFSGPTTCHPAAVPFNNASSVQGNGALNYQWSFGDNTNSNTTSPSHAYTNAGSYTVQLIATGPGNCADTIVHVVNTPPTPTANFTLPAGCGMTQAFTNTSTISNGTITSHAWNFNPGTSNTISPSHTFSNPGNYNVVLTVTSDSGCTNTMTLPYVANAIPVAAFSGPTTCHPAAVPFNNTSNIQGGGALNYQWSFGDNNTSTTSSPSHAYANAGSYTVQLIATGPGNCADTIFHVVNTPPTPVANFTLPGSCGMSHLFTNASTISNGSITNNAWNFNPGTYNSTNASHTFGTPGSFNVSLTVTSDSGCANTITLPYVANAVPVAAFNSTSVCFGNTTDLLDQSTVQNSTINQWQWNLGFSTSTTQNGSLVFPQDGSTPVQLIVWAANGCSDTITQNVTVHPMPQPAFTAQPVCRGLMTQFTDQTTINSGNIAQYTWAMDPGGSLVQNPVITYGQWGDHNVTLAVVSDQGCANSITSPVHVWPRPVLDFGFNPRAGCVPLMGQFETTVSIEEGFVDNFQWDFGDGKSSIAKNPQHTYVDPGTFTVTLTATSDKGCDTSVTKVNYITGYPKPLAEFNYSPSHPTVLDPVVQFNNQSVGGLIYNWNFGDGSGSDAEHPQHTYPADTGTYYIVLATENEYGCKDTVQHVLTLEPGYTVFIPNTFTPNSDGDNETFKIYGMGIEEAELHIFNRWGDKIALLTNDEAMDKGWDGTHYGKIVKEDVYVYRALVKDFNGQWHELSGQVNIIR